METLAAQPSIQYELVDSIAEVAERRRAIRESAEGILEQRRIQGGEASELLPVDALSTAHKVLDASRTYGHGSERHKELSDGLVLDCQRLVGEWYRKRTSEYFAPTRHVFDADTQEFFSHGLSIRQMTENALVPMNGDAEEETRRINERVEDATPQILRGLGKIALGSQVVRTVSECTDKAITDYESDIQQGRKHRGYGGYVPEIKKVMIRDIRLDTASDDRFQEQVGLPGIYLTHEVIAMALEQRGAAVGSMNKAELHGAQILAEDGLMEFVAHLDTVASEQWCTNIFMGEEVPADFVKDYAGFREEALRRQEKLKDIAGTVATFVLDLAEDGIDRRVALVMVEDFVKKQLLELGKKDEAAAEHMFDARTAAGLKEVKYLESVGRHHEAFNRMLEVEKEAPGGGYCGAGSCGLESVNMRSEAGKELVSKVKAEAGDTVVRDTERSCRCGKKTIVYAYNKNKVNKYCESCGSFESKQSKVA